MRVTNKMLSYNFLKDMRNNLSNMRTMQQQMTSGKEISRPSDDPAKVARVMQLYSDIGANKQYNENIKDTINWLDVTDTALDQGGNVLQRVRELLIASGNAAYGSEELKAIKDEINEKISEFSQILNTNFDGKYVFGGTRGTTKPVDTTLTGDKREIHYNAKDGTKLPSGAIATPAEQEQLDNIASKLNTEVSQGVTVEYNVTAKDILEFKTKRAGVDTPIDVREVFSKIVNHLNGKKDDGTDPVAPETPSQYVKEASNGDLQNITDVISNLLKIRAEVGAKQNRMDSAKDRNTEENFNMTEILSETEDINITEKTMEFANMQTVYLASLQTSAKIIQPSLMDYLR